MGLNVRSVWTRRLTALSHQPKWTGVISHWSDWSCAFAAYPLPGPDSTYSFSLSLSPSHCEKSYSSKRLIYRILCSTIRNWPKCLAVDRVQPISALSQIQAARWVYLQVMETASPLPLQAFCNGLERERSVLSPTLFLHPSLMCFLIATIVVRYFFSGGCGEPSPWGSVVSRTFSPTY